MNKDSKPSANKMLWGGVVFALTVVCALIAIPVWVTRQFDSQPQVVTLDELNSILERLSSIENKLQQVDAVDRIIPREKPYQGRLVSESPDATWSVDKLLSTYLSAKTWPERIPLTLDPDETRAQMEAYYSRGYTRPSSYNIQITDDFKLETGETAEIPVELGNRITRYIVMQTNDGPRLDWLASRKRWDEQRNLAVRTRWGLVDAKLDITVHRVMVEYGRTKAEVLVRNKSDARIELVHLSNSAYGFNQKFLGSGNTLSISNIPPRGESAGTLTFNTDISPASIADWRFNITLMTIIGAGGEEFREAGRLFEIIVHN